MVIYEVDVIASDECDYANAKAFLDLVKDAGFEEYVFDCASFALNDLRIFVKDYETERNMNEN